jgi:hypothetical protein
MVMFEYSLHGLSLRVPFRISGDAFCNEAPSGDFISIETVPELAILPEGRSWLLSQKFGDGTSVELFRLADESHLLEFAGYRFLISPTNDRVEVEVTATEELYWLRVLTEGWLIAVLLHLRGLIVLHASSVMIDDVLVGFVGSSGMGKSTCAAALCAAGAQLFGDDILAVDPAHNMYAYRGGPSLRMRIPVLADSALVTERVETVGDRCVATLARSVPTKSKLGVLFMPIVSDEHSKVTWSWLAPPEAIAALALHPRISTWSDRPWIEREFANMVEVGSNVRVANLFLPLGLIDPPQLLASISAAISELSLMELNVTDG